jgi:hypothetical protein
VINFSKTRFVEVKEALEVVGEGYVEKVTPHPAKCKGISVSVV